MPPLAAALPSCLSLALQMWSHRQGEMRGGRRGAPHLQGGRRRNPLLPFQAPHTLFMHPF